jgi:hypothetical protein
MPRKPASRRLAESYIDLVKEPGGAWTLEVTALMSERMAVRFNRGSIFQPRIERL